LESCCPSSSRSIREPKPGWRRPGSIRSASASGGSKSAPLGYLDFLALEAKAAFVLTDSGGIQEETSALGVRCFTLRDTTERPVTVELGTNVILGMDPDRIRTIPQLLEDVTRPPGEIPLWDGRTGGRAAGILNEFLSRPAVAPDSPPRKRAVGELSDLT